MCEHPNCEIGKVGAVSIASLHLHFSFFFLLRSQKKKYKIKNSSY